jgi:hypothetical protein
MNGMMHLFEAHAGMLQQHGTQATGANNAELQSTLPTRDKHL